MGYLVIGLLNNWVNRSLNYWVFGSLGALRFVFIEVFEEEDEKYTQEKGNYAGQKDILSSLGFDTVFRGNGRVNDLEGNVVLGFFDLGQLKLLGEEFEDFLLDEGITFQAGKLQADSGGLGKSNEGPY